MLFISLAVSSVFVAGFGVMVKEVLSAPVALQDADGFHLDPDNASLSEATVAPKRIRRVRQVRPTTLSLGRLQAVQAH